MKLKSTINKIMEYLCLVVAGGAAGSIITLLYFSSSITWDSNKWNSLGVWVGAIGAGIFAYFQIKQNNRAYHYEISERYIDNYSNLIEVLDCYEDSIVRQIDENNFTSDWHEFKKFANDKYSELLKKITKVKNDAKLILSDDVVKIVTEIYQDLNIISYAQDGVALGNGNYRTLS